MRRRIQPVPAALPLLHIARWCRPGERLGVWIPAAGRARPSAVYRSAPLVLSANLEALLGTVERVLVWGGGGVRILPVGRSRRLTGLPNCR
jgi:hypothetical protein